MIKTEQLKAILGPIVENPEAYKKSMIARGLSKDGFEVVELVLQYRIFQAAEKAREAGQALRNEFSKLMKNPEFRELYAEFLEKSKKSKTAEMVKKNENS